MEPDSNGDSEEDRFAEEDMASSYLLRSRKSRKRGGWRSSRRLRENPKKKLKVERKERKLARQQSKRAAPPSQSARARKKLNLELQVLPTSKAESAVTAIIDLRCSQSSQHRQASGGVRREQRGLEVQLCEALLDEVCAHKDSWPFLEPVKKKEVRTWDVMISEG